MNLAGAEGGQLGVILEGLDGGRRTGRGALAGALALLATTGAALFASATAGEPDAAAPAIGAEPSTRSAERIARELTPMVAARVERIRGLEFDRVPVPEVITGERFAEISAREAERNPGLRRQLGDSEAVARLLGLMSPAEQLDLLAEGASDLAAAAYDTERERLYVIHDASGDDPALLEFLLAHELDHALEDQAFGLAELDSATDDEALASLALVEGSATAVMIDYASRHLDPLALSAAGAGIDPGTDGVPRFFVESLTWAYLRGAGFVGSLLTDDGDRWSRVDAAFEGRPPASTEQVLHPRRYRHAEDPLTVATAITAARRRGFEPVARGVLGEYSTAQLLRLGAPREVAARAAAGWGGDEYVLASRDGGGTDCERTCRRERVLVIQWRWDTDAEAKEFANTLPAYLVGGLGGDPRSGQTWRLEGGGWAAVATTGGATRLVFAPSDGLARSEAAAIRP